MRSVKRYLGVAFVSGVLLTFAYFLNDIFLTIIFAILGAYCVAPLTTFFSRLIGIFTISPKIVWNISCLLSILTVLTLVIFSLCLIGPFLYSQCNNLYNLLSNESTYLEILSYYKTNIIPILEMPILISFKEYIESSFSNITSVLLNQSASITKQVTAYALHTSHSFILSLHNLLKILLGFVISFHTLREWDMWGPRIKRALATLGPSGSKVIIILTNLHYGIQNWIKGQILISLGISIFYSGIWVLVQIRMPILFGLLFGFAGIVPYVIEISALIVFIIMGICFEYSIWQYLALLITLGVGHIIVGYTVGPALIGKYTGVHPLQGILGFLINAKLFGIPGVLLNMPICIIFNSIISVIFGESKQETRINKT